MLYLTRHLRFLCDPQTGEDLFPIPEGLASYSHQYAIQEGVYCLSARSLDSESLQYDEACLAQGWTPPDEADFISLPHSILAGWGGDYWQSRALSLAAIWEILEGERRKHQRPPIGFQGVAAHLTHSLPYAAYALEVGGFHSYALSPHRGRFSLGVYATGRYARVQSTWEALPLQANCFDVVVMSGLLDELPRPQAEKLLRQTLALLTPQGKIFISDVPDIEAWQAVIASLGAKSQLVSVTSQLRSLWRQNPPVPPLMIVYPV